MILEVVKVSVYNFYVRDTVAIVYDKSCEGESFVAAT